MVIDSSALVAILQNEAPAQALIQALEQASFRYISAVTLVEAAIVVLSRLGDSGERELDRLVDKLGLTVVPVTNEHASIARSAFRRFGKGRHPARLNFGDCFSYALSMSLNEPLLFVGEDFSETDVPR